MEFGDIRYDTTDFYLSMAVQPFVGPWPLFQFLDLYTVGRTPWTGDQPVSRPLPAYRTVQTPNKRTQISMPQMGFEPTIPVFEGAKTVHALADVSEVLTAVCEASILSCNMITFIKLSLFFRWTVSMWSSRFQRLSLFPTSVVDMMTTAFVTI
jgi:hypothetical protein